MKSHRMNVLAFSVVGLVLSVQLGLTGLAAKKYYPPGFVPPLDQNSAPTSTDLEPPAINPQIIIKTVAKSVQAKPKDPLSVLMDEHRYYDALRMVDARLKKTPGNTSLQLLRGQILMGEGQYRQAIEQFEWIAEKHKTKAVRSEALNGLGWAGYKKALHEQQAGDENSARKSLQAAGQAFGQASQLNPSLAPAWAGLGHVALLEGLPQDAEKHIKKAVRLAPNNLTAQLAQATLLLARQKPEEALQILYGIKKTTTHEPEVYLLLAQASLDTDKIDDAIINLKQLLAFVPDHTGALRLLSQSYERKMKPADAEQVLQKAIVLNPDDRTSVEALLKIYEQRGETERGVLLLKTLLKNRPGQVAYGRALLERLGKLGRWSEAYQEGTLILEPVLASGASEAELSELAGLFAQTVYQQGKGLLDRRELLNEPAVQRAKVYTLGQAEKQIANEELALPERLNVLLLDPLAKLPPLPEAFEPGAADLRIALQVAYLEGTPALYERLLTMAKTSDNPIECADALYRLGDYRGAQALVNEVLAANPSAPQALDLQGRIGVSLKNLEEQLASLALLPRKISDSYWERAAGEVLKLGSGDWKTHARLADGLERRRHPELALIHQMLAAQYAPTPKEKERWLQKVSRTTRALDKTSNKESQR